MIRRWIIISMILAGVSVYYLVSLGDRRVRQVIRNSIRGIEQADLAQTFQWVSDDYYDEYGYSIGEMKEIAREAFRNFEEIHVAVQDMEVKRGERAAEVILDFRVVATYQYQRGYILGNFNDTVKVTIHLVLENEGWKIIRLDDFHEFVR